VIELVSELNEVAVMGGKSEVPKYSSSSEAAAILQAKLKSAADTDQDYVDVIAKRGQALRRS
jgi:hypothetical protein